VQRGIVAVKSPLTCTECLLLGETGITAAGTTAPATPQSSLRGQAPRNGRGWLSPALASPPRTQQLCPRRASCWAVPLCTGSSGELALPAKSRTSLAASVSSSPRQSWGSAPVPQCSPLQPELPHGYGQRGQERVKLSAL